MAAITIDPKLLERVNGAIDDVRAGKMVILVDDEDRENEGDLCMAAEFVTSESINFMATHGRGLICVTLTEEQVERLGLPMMQSPGRSGPPLGTAFTVSVEARHGVTTGISAHDRAYTTRLVASEICRPEDLVTPGHVFPLKARKGGVLVRTGQTEGSVDLARLAGLTPAGVICEIMNDDGSMARMPDLEAFGKKHGLRILTVAELIQYRLQTERLVKRVAEKKLILDDTGTEWASYVYESATDGRQFLALVKGEIDPETPTLCRMHSGSLVGDLFASTRREGGRNLREAIARIEAEGSGIVVYLPMRGPVARDLDANRVEPMPAATSDHPLREFGLGAQVLSDLGARKLKLLTNSPRKIAGIHGFGLEVTETVPLVSMGPVPKPVSSSPRLKGQA
ncbi:MAG TPA: 3,4-dihydroxy-2-butanone-4-phosphate synthase [Polyangiaceae bacterium]|jgi:3,4-dihydroxy 2-butanone 4-phosphate synthase/GTP cyclohydrolase II